MHKKPSDRLAALTPGDISAVIQMAWEDRTTFETIHERLGLSEPEVIRLMRAELQPSSFKMWRERTRGRVTKHRALRPAQMKFDDHAVADHRRANACHGSGLSRGLNGRVQNGSIQVHQPFDKVHDAHSAMKQVHAILTVLLAALGSHAFAQIDTAAPTPQPAALTPPPAVQLVQVRVLSTTPVQVTTAQGMELSYKTVYELNGQQFSVQLPQDPGDHLLLQMPTQPLFVPAPMAASTVQVQTVVGVPYAPYTPYAPYPSVLFVGSLYRPLPYIGGIHHSAGGGRFGRRGGRH